MCKSGQNLNLRFSYSLSLMAKTTHQKAQIEKPLNELESQQQLGQIVSKVVKELENGVTQAMWDVCRQESQ